ncbi:hypothetical protein EAE96_009546 [Botrytis aclada]|nr:hypothetical protein EAE96_009546 [Botrytis aclada]
MADHPSQIQLQPEQKEVIQDSSRLPSEIRRMIWKYAAGEAIKIFNANDAQDTSIFLNNGEVGGMVREKNTHNWPNTFELPHLHRLNTFRKKDLLFSLLHVDREAREVAWKAYMSVINEVGFLGHFFMIFYTRKYSKYCLSKPDLCDTLFGNQAQATENIRSRILTSAGMGYDWANNGALQLLTDVHETLQSRLMEPPGHPFWRVQLVPGAEAPEQIIEERGPFKFEKSLPQPSPDPKLWDLRKGAFEPTFLQEMTAYLDNFDVKCILVMSSGYTMTHLLTSPRKI